jgi:hypothetical protein
MPTGMCQNDQKHKQNEHSAQGISSFFREKKTMQKDKSSFAANQNAIMVNFIS